MSRVHERNDMGDIDTAYGKVYFWRYYDKKDLRDIELTGPEPGSKAESGMRLVKYHCGECLLIFGYDRPVDCPGCGAIDSMKPGKPGILTKHK